LDAGGAAPQAGLVTDMPARQRTARGRVLVVDDERRIRDVVVRILNARGIDADATADGASAVAMNASGYYDLVILDLLMPGQDGFVTLRKIMNDKPTQAVLVLSCLTDPESVMASLGLGADDYVPKPFHVGELAARVQARLRAIARAGPPILNCGRLRLDVLRMQADAGNGPVYLSSRETQLLWELMADPGAIVSKDDLLAKVWRGEQASMSNVVDVYIRRLRSRLGPEAITTVRGQGYRVGTG
jgi:DNA-binding response OmpR family regulator